MPRHRHVLAALPFIAATFAFTACQPSTTAQGSLSSPLADAPVPAATASPAHAPIKSHAVVAAKPRPGATTHAPSASHRSVDGLPLPNPQLTPGEAFTGVGPATFCVSGYTARVRSVSQSLRYQVFAEYHISYSQHADYEVDHLIPLELGGDNSIKNLWPEKGSLPNAKDGLENQLHNLVCKGQLSTAAAQHAIATNWVSALHSYGSSGSVYERSTSPSSGTTTKTTPPTSGNGQGATAKCKDGTYSHAAHHQGACSHHGGVAVWYR